MMGENSLADFLTNEQQDRLETLILEHNRDIGDVGLIELSSALLGRYEMLEKMELNRVPI